MPQSRFIVLEGLEGAGKSGAAAVLRQALESRGEKVHLCREPGGTPLAEELRRLVKDTALSETILPETELLMMFAARCQLLGNVIRPALEAGDWVICDRFIDSTRVYQGALGKVDMKLIRSLERVTVGATMPDLTFVLDVPANIGLARAKTRRGTAAADRFESEANEFHEELRRAFLVLAEREPKRIVAIDGRAPRDVVADRIWAAVEERLLGDTTPAIEAATP